MKSSTATAPAWDRVWLGANLARMTGGPAYNDRHDPTGRLRDPSSAAGETSRETRSSGELRDTALAIKDGRIAWIGSRRQLDSMQWSAANVTLAEGLWITPGLVECHTHLVHGGDRSNEFAARLRGATYEEISRAGGGIVATMRATRTASEDQLLEQSLPRALALAAEGVTTLEIKSGYGLDLDNELKMLRVAQRIGEVTGLTVIKTFLGAHALPPEFMGRQEDYVRHVCDDMLPAVAAARLADAVDVFCERIAFTQEQTRRIFERARELGLPARLHADQLSDGNGGEIAADCGALSADHLEHTSERSLLRMAERGVVAGLLPGAFYYLRETKLPPIARLRELNIPMAVSTDCNPGTSPIASLLTAMNMACVMFRLTAAETLRGVTANAARALGLAKDRGTLEVGARADLAIWRLRHPEQLCAEVGVHRPVEIVLANKLRTPR